MKALEQARRQRGARTRNVIALAVIAAGATGVALLARTQRMIVADSVTTLPADGRAHRIANIKMRYGNAVSSSLSVSGEGDATLRVGATGAELWDRAPVFPAVSTLHVRTTGFFPRAATVRVRYTLDTRDSFGDGTPDALRLHTPEDRAAMRRSLVFLAELENARNAAGRAPEIQDCAGLLRFCYRESVRMHDEAWLAAMRLENAPVPPNPSQWHYPATPFGAGLFRVVDGPLLLGQLTAASEAFAEFADAKTLWRDNTTLVSRNVRDAKPGDLLFYLQLGQNSPYHSMLVTAERGAWVIYHTGAIEHHAGEIRRVSTSELLQHPDARWRPEPGNANFLGVYRWNILREDP